MPHDKDPPSDRRTPTPGRARRRAKLPPASADDLPSDLLERPALEGARWLALLRLEQFRAARERTHEGEEGLHDFRVALRRLRSVLRELREPLEGSVSGKMRRRLATLATPAGARRDLDVHLAWLAAERESLGHRERQGADQLEHALRREWRDADATLRRELARDHDRAVARLARRLGRYRLTIVLGERREPAGTRAMLAAILDRLGDELGSAAARIRGLDDDRAIHRTRIATKRLRYVLEPLAARGWRRRSLSRAAHEVIDELKELQEALGQMHDAHVLGAWLADRAAEAAARGARLAASVDGATGEVHTSDESDVSAAVRALQGRLRDRAAEQWRSFERGDRARQFARLVERAHAIATRLAAVD